MKSPRPMLYAVVFATALAALTLPAAPAHSEGRIVLAGLRMDPTDLDARRFSRPGWGGAAELVAPLPVSWNLLAGVVGVDGVSLMSRTLKMIDPYTGLRLEQQTEQHYFRFYLGTQFGPHSSGFLRPYAGVNVAAVLYGISTDVVVPDDSDRENEIRQNLRDREEAAFGWDANAGLDMNFGAVSLDAGVRFLHAYGVPQQLGGDAVTIQPAYVQYKLGLGIGMHTLLH